MSATDEAWAFKEVERLQREVDEWKHAHQLRLEEINELLPLKSEVESLRGQVESAKKTAHACVRVQLQRELENAQLNAALKKAKECLSMSDDLLGEIHAYGDCDCHLDDICIPCQCGNQRKPNSDALAAIKECGVE